MFKSSRMHFIHIDFNSLLPNLEEMLCLARKTNAFVTGISETKHDGIVLSNEVSIQGYDLLS